jgi:hypothetical protein
LDFNATGVEVLETLISLSAGFKKSFSGYKTIPASGAGLKGSIPG